MIKKLASLTRIITNRLLLNVVETTDNVFIYKLLNSPGWLEFIGDRGVRSAEEAITYINDICERGDLVYWVVRLKETNSAMGIITYLKRTYLDKPDLGFAFLPEYEGRGYAREAASAILAKLLQYKIDDQLLAITLPANKKSINLLTRLGFAFETQLLLEKNEMQVFKILMSA